MPALLECACDASGDIVQLVDPLMELLVRYRTRRRPHIAAVHLDHEGDGRSRPRQQGFDVGALSGHVLAVHGDQADVVRA